MKINKRSIRKSALAAVITVLIGIASSCTDIWSEQHPGTFYITDGQTVATFLEEYQDEDGNNPFTDFIAILQRAHLWADLKTYGDRTLFAPTNDAIQQYLKERMDLEPDLQKKHYFDNVESLPDSINDSIAKTHICRASVFIKDMNKKENGTLPSSNLLDRYMTYSAIPDSSDPTQIRVAYMINQYSKIIEPDDSLVNGVVQVVDRVIAQSNLMIPGYLYANNKKADYLHQANIFYQALVMTKLNDTLEMYKDDSYPEPQYDSTFACLEFNEKKLAVKYETAYETGKQAQRVVWPTERLFKYTFFVVSDSILKAKYNITSLDGLIAKAKEVYDDPAHINDDPKLPTSPLYKLISYHILPFWAYYSEFNFTNEKIVDDYVKNGIEENDAPKMIDMQDFYETMQPYAIMRISTPYDPKAGGDKGKLFINRKGTVSAGNLTHRGIRIWNPNEYQNLPNGEKLQTDNALNGGYYFVDDLLLFDDNTKSALKTRMRFTGTTLSPDFMNSVRRDRMRSGELPTEFAVTAFKRGYCRNFSATDQTLFVVRYQDKGWGCFNHDEINIRGIFNLTLRLPPVPEDNTYEIRIWGNALGTSAPKRDRGYVQFYFQEANGNPVPCGLPVNMGLRPEDPQIGFVKDEELKKNKSAEEGQDAIIANDKAMRNRGYMKAPKSAQANGTNFRDEAGCFRKIVYTTQMKHGVDYYLQFRQVQDMEDAVCPLCILEIVPKEIYDSSVSATPEDVY